MDKKHTEETKRKIGKANSIALKGRKLSEEHKRNIGKFRKGKGLGFSHWRGKKMTREHRKNLSEAHKGKKKNKETRKRMSKSKKMEKHPNWKGGKSFEPYSVDWTETLKRSIRERDNYISQLCSKLQGDRVHSVHHIDYDKKNNNPDNLITLCKSCHCQTNFKRDYWTNYFKSKRQ